MANCLIAGTIEATHTEHCQPLPPYHGLHLELKREMLSSLLQAFYVHNDELILLAFVCQLLTKIPTLTTLLEAIVDPPFVAFVNNDFHEQVVAS